MLRILKQYYPIRNALFVVGETMFILLSINIASWIILSNQFSLVFDQMIVKALLITGISQLCLYYNDLYDMQIADTIKEVLMRLFQSIGVAAIVLALIYIVFPFLIIGNNVFFLSVLFIMSFIVLWRIAYLTILRLGWFNQRIVVLGSGELANKILDAITNKNDCGYQVSVIESFPEDCVFPKGREPLSICKNRYYDLCDMVKGLGIKKIVVAIEQRRNHFPAKELMQCRLYGIDVIEGTSFYEMLMGKLIVDQINPSWLIFSEGFQKSTLKRFLKRSIDVIFFLLLFVFLWPVLLVTAILIKFESPGPVFYSQERVGKNKKLVMIHKFRSMMKDAEKKSGPVWAKDDDPRVTRVGKFIRKWRIDELPQIFNVIKGDLSLVGPRPEREFFVKDLEKIIPYYSQRFSVKPGVTGWAQVQYHYGDSIEDAKEKLNYDLFYIKNMTFLFDIAVILKTVKTVLFGEGAR